MGTPNVDVAAGKELLGSNINGLPPAVSPPGRGGDWILCKRGLQRDLTFPGGVLDKGGVRWCFPDLEGCQPKSKHSQQGQSPHSTYHAQLFLQVGLSTSRWTPHNWHNCLRPLSRSFPLCSVQRFHCSRHPLTHACWDRILGSNRQARLFGHSAGAAFPPAECPGNDLAPELMHPSDVVDGRDWLW